MPTDRRERTPDADADKSANEAALDEALDESFPASDPPATTSPGHRPAGATKAERSERKDER